MGLETLHSLYWAKSMVAAGTGVAIDKFTDSSAVVRAQYVGPKAALEHQLTRAIDDLKQLKEQTLNQEKETRSRLAKRLRAMRARLNDKAHKAIEDKIAAEELLLLEKSQRLYREQVRNAEKDCLNLALGIAQEVTSTTFDCQPELLAKQIKEQLDVLVDNQRIKVLVNPNEQEELLQALREQGIAAVVEASNEITKGAAALIIPSGSIEINWRHHLDRIAEALHAQLENKNITRESL